MQNFHLALATKQPSMTGATLARIIHNYRDTSKVAELINYVQRIFRTQLAAALGNIMAVGVGAVVFSLLWKLAYGQPFLSAETAEVFGHFFGVPLDVRHVTLSTGTMAFGVASRGPEFLGRGALVWASLGIAATFVLNLSVSFYLALRLALRAQDVPSRDHLEILRNLWRQFRATPRDFFFPPPQNSPAQTQSSH
jgi:site-specific recombinase